MRIRKIGIVLLSVVLVYLVFISGKNSAVNRNERDISFVADPNLYYNIQDIYSSQKADELQKRFNRLNKKGIFNGTVLYSEHGEEVYKGAFGYEDFRKKTKLQQNSAFQLASVSKMFTAYAIMILKEEGKLSFDDTLTHFIPEFPYYGITIRQLLNHRSGLSRYMSLADKHWDVNKSIRNEDVIKLFVDYKPAPYFRPNNGFHYCNTNYVLLASVAERISGQEFDDFVKERIFNPLGMSESFVYHMENDSAISYQVPVGVPGYRLSRRRLVKVGDYYLNGVMGDKGVYSSVEDLFKFNLAFDNGFPVKKETLQEAFLSGSPKYYNRKDGYGFGWRIKDDMDSTAYHFGWWKGFRTYFIRDMENERTLIALTNTHQGVSSKVIWDMIKDENRAEGLFEIYKTLNELN